MLIHVGKVERIVLGKRQFVCACCALSVDNCTCQHDQQCFDTSCINRKSTY